MLRRFCFLAAPLLALAGCGISDKDAQYDDPRNPYYKQAQQDIDANNPEQAIRDYNNALQANPNLAGAHYSLGQLYGDKLNDPIGAIYHYKEYLRLAPNSDKAADIKALIDKQSLSFAASLPNSTPQNAEAYAQLQSANADLKKQLDDATKLVGQLQANAAANPSTANAPSPAPAVVTVAPVALTPASSAPTPTIARALPVDPHTPTPGGRSYKVVAGDSFWKIAKKMYLGDTKNGVTKIKESNKDTVPDDKHLKPGQVLIIPD